MHLKPSPNLMTNTPGHAVIGPLETRQAPVVATSTSGERVEHASDAWLPVSWENTNANFES